MNGLFEETGAAEVFARRLREVGAGSDSLRIQEQVGKCSPPELDAWVRHDLTYADSSIGRDAAAWGERTAALGKLQSYRRTILAARGQAAAMADKQTVDNSVWMDATTLTGSLDLIFGRTDGIAPTTLVDLETFVRAVVLYDHIFYLAPDSPVDLAALNERWNERLLLPLPVEEADIRPPAGRIATPLGALLYAIYTQATLWMKRRDDGPVQAELWDVMLARWETVLGWRPQVEEMEWGFDSGVPSPASKLVTWLRLFPDFGREAHLNAHAAPDDFVKPYWLITESTARALFNYELARTLELPYLGNVARIPFRQALVARQRAATKFITSRPLDGVLDAAVRESAARLPTGAAVLPMPTFTAALMHRATRASGLPDALQELRADTANLRARRAELQASLNDDTKNVTLQRLQEAVTAEARKLPYLETGGLIAAAGQLWVSLAFASATPMHILTTLGLLQVAAEAKPVAEGLVPRIRRPYEHVLNDLGSVARGSAGAIPRLQQLSYHPASGDWDQFAEGLRRLGRLGVG